jgi:hypothetical protein
MRIALSMRFSLIVTQLTMVLLVSLPRVALGASRTVYNRGPLTVREIRSTYSVFLAHHARPSFAPKSQALLYTLSATHSCKVDITSNALSFQLSPRR